MPAELIRVNERTKDRLTSLKVHPEETYCDVIERLIDMAVDDELTPEEEEAVITGLKEFEAGETISHKELGTRLGLI